MDKLIIVMPLYNEALNIESTVAEWHPITEYGKNSILLLVDDGSKDNSVDILKKLVIQYPNLRYISKANEGHGPTIRYAYQEALNLGADYIFQTDSDGQTRASEFEGFWKQRTEFDVQIGRRYRREDGFSRKIVSFVLKIIVRIFFRVSTVDPNCPFRLFNRQTLEEFLPLIPNDFTLTNVLLSTYTSYTKKKHRYVNIQFSDRKAGTNSINLKRIVRIAIDNIKLFPKLNKQMRKELHRR